MNRVDIEHWVDENFDALLQDAMDLIALRSVCQPPVDQYPYGVGCAQALDTALQISSRMGFSVEYHQYHCGSALLRGETQKEIGIFTHLDVVHEGDSWEKSPYSPQIEDGWLYGRGSADNKGPAMAALYALAYLKQQGKPLKHTVRIYFGCNEESGMQDMRHFLRFHQPPCFSFTPDAAFPVCYGEKGLIEAEFSAALQGRLKSFSAGVASNAVAAFAQAEFADVTLTALQIEDLSKKGVAVKQQPTGVLLTATGKAAHAAQPENSENAAVKLAAALVQADWLTAQEQQPLQLLAQGLADYYGTGVRIDCEDEASGKLTVVAGLTRTENGKLIQNVNIRYPIAANGEQLCKQLKASAAEYGWLTLFTRNDAPMFVPPQSKAVQTLVQVCNQTLGTQLQPYTMGGGTYARRLPNAVGFGPGLRGQQKPGPVGHGGGHQPDECISLEILRNAVVIYVQAIEALDEVLSKEQA